MIFKIYGFTIITKKLGRNPISKTSNKTMKKPWSTGKPAKNYEMPEEYKVSAIENFTYARKEPTPLTFSI